MLCSGMVCSVWYVQDMSILLLDRVRDGRRESKALTVNYNCWSQVNPARALFQCFQLALSKSRCQSFKLKNNIGSRIYSGAESQARNSI